MKNSADPWKDADGAVSGTDSRGHAVFTAPEWGIRAGILQLRAYFMKHGLRTIRTIIARWAPADDTQGSLAGRPPNDPGAYANFVARRMDIGVDEELDLFNDDGRIDDVEQLRALFYAMAANEIGGAFRVPDEEFDAGVNLVEG